MDADAHAVHHGRSVDRRRHWDERPFQRSPRGARLDALRLHRGDDVATFEIIEIEPQQVAVVRGAVALDRLPDFFGSAFTAVMAALEAQGVAPTGPPFGYYPTHPTEVVEVEAGFPTASAIDAQGDVVPAILPGGRAVSCVHVGPYDTLTQTYAELEAWVADQGLEPAAGMWEIYLSDPASEPDPNTWRTQIIWPVR
jgi:effector-binding domain-containing protein